MKEAQTQDDYGMGKRARCLTILHLGKPATGCLLALLEDESLRGHMDGGMGETQMTNSITPTENTANLD